MENYKVEFSKSAEKEIKGLPSTEIKKIWKKIDSLRSNPRGPGVKKLRLKDYYRIRAGNYRIIFEIKDDTLIIYIFKVDHRKDVYRF